MYTPVHHHDVEIVNDGCGPLAYQFLVKILTKLNNLAHGFGVQLAAINTLVVLLKTGPELGHQLVHVAKAPCQLEQGNQHFRHLNQLLFKRKLLGLYKIHGILQPHHFFHVRGVCLE